ncbi:MAG: hypothetical protein JWM73_1591 [Solirubrobacterales bacterium]|jgi:hypothetical protein|nr:hypothetical protein [Solirubrobacterales bacterium]
MPDLLALPLRVADLATRPARFVLGKLLELRHSDDDKVAPVADAPVPPPAPGPPQSAPAKKPAPARRAPSPKAARRATRHEPTKGEVGKIRQQRHMEEQDAGSEGGPGATIEVAEPWPGYETMTEDQVLERLTGADPTVRAVVRLYESMHGSRRQILLATEETVAT